MICSPSDLKDLTAGYLLTSGIIGDDNALTDLKYEESKSVMHIELEDNSVIKDMIFSKLRPVGCGAGTLLFSDRHISGIKEDRIKITGESISELMNEFNRASDLFRETGGVHSAAVSDGKKILVAREDIGRHNAFDKAAGNLYLTDQILKDKVVLTSGRISSEIMLKMIYANIPVIISRSAPTTGALELAEKYGITTIGFARSTNFNIYTHSERVVLNF
jgi:FdhD protein